jgi:hypothetical protein
MGGYCLNSFLYGSFSSERFCTQNYAQAQGGVCPGQAPFLGCTGKTPFPPHLVTCIAPNQCAGLVYIGPVTPGIGCQMPNQCLPGCWSVHE